MVPYEKLVEEDLNLGVGAVTLDAPAGGTMPGTQINLASFGSAGSASWGPGSITAAGSASTTVPVTGSALGDLVLVAHDECPGGLVLSGVVTVAGTVTVYAFNPTSGALVLNSGTLKVVTFTIP